MENPNITSAKTNRRKFIQTTGAALGATVAFNLGSPIHAFSSGSNTLKVGLIGCGGRGAGAASQALEADPDTIITALGDVFSDRLDETYQALLEMYPTRVKVDKSHKFVGFDAYKKVIESDVDVVLLATPPPSDQIIWWRLLMLENIPFAKSQ